jgi:hypothetical protein
MILIHGSLTSKRSEKYMNKYFEYMTGYIVLILKAYIKMGVFLNGTTVGNFALLWPMYPNTHNKFC